MESSFKGLGWRNMGLSKNPAWPPGPSLHRVPLSVSGLGFRDLLREPTWTIMGHGMYC